jgi:cyclohexyl-isocyanide hydratase
MPSRKKNKKGTKGLTKAPFIVGIVLYPGFDLLDVAGMNEVWTFVDASLAGRPIKVITVAADNELAALAPLTVKPSCTFADDPKIDLLFVPGAGDGLTEAIKDATLHQFLRRKAKRATYVTSVCTGALVLAAAGLLDGYQATCHWSVIDCLKLFPDVTVVNGFPRYLRDRNRFTGGGISSSIDEALFMVQQVVTDLTGEASNGDAACQRVQLAIQYNPDPPFRGGDPASVAFSVFEPVEEPGMREFRAAVCKAVREHIGG